jgi:predicted nucleic acid-binding protein
MPFVLDASVTACWAFADEDHPLAAVALTRLRSDHALVPALWWFEVRNILVVNERRQRLTTVATTSFLRELSELAIAQDLAPAEAEILRLARTHRLTAYDAAYLELAQRHNVALATLDDALIRAARSELVPILGEDA